MSVRKTFLQSMVFFLCILLSSVAGAQCPCSTGKKTLVDQVSDVCRAYREDPEFRKICEQVDSTVRLTCADGKLTKLDQYGLRGGFSGAYKGTVAFLAPPIQWVWEQYFK